VVTACAGSAGSIGSQSYACTPRFKRRRYICPSHAASAMRDNSRQTDLKRPGYIRVACFCHAPRLLSVTAKPRFESFRTCDVVGLPRSLPRGCHNRATSRRSVRVPFGRVVGGSLVEFAVERGATDLEPACDFRHLTAIMRDRKTDDLVFHVVERPHLAG